MVRRLAPVLVRAAIVAGVAAVVAYGAFLRPMQLRWGATDGEVVRPMPGDSILSAASFEATRAVTIDARPEQVWPWIVQMGWGRGGFYGYDRMDNGGVPSADRILPKFQFPQTGDIVPTGPDRRAGYLVKGFSRNRYMLWEARSPRATWCWALYPVGTRQTRLVTRIKFRHRWTSLAIVRTLAADVGNIFATRKSMLGIKARAEARN